MENMVISKRELKPSAKKNNASGIRVSKATKKLASQIKDKANEKQFGKKVQIDKIVAKALTKLTQDDIKDLQDNSLTNGDRFDRDYVAYCAKHGKVSEDEYLGLVMSGQNAGADEIKKMP